MAVQGSLSLANREADSSGRRRLPPWLRIQLPAGDAHRRYNGTHALVDEGGLVTVCQEARCPNIHDCWARGTATFMVAGEHCTRGCRFCAVQTLRQPPPLDENEPAHLAAAVERMHLAHVVITVVNRDDLADGGADHYRRCVQAIADRLPEVTIELLSSDLAGDEIALGHLLHQTPLSVFAHNVECVPRLDAQVRDRRASFAQSLRVLRCSKRLRPDLLTKSSIMVGLGETDQEVSEVMGHLREADVDLVTLGQYLSPGQRFLPIQRFVPPEQFDAWDEEARRLGFKAVASGPMVRSSYRAGLLLEEARTGRRLTPPPHHEPANHSQPSHGNTAWPADAIVDVGSLAASALGLRYGDDRGLHQVHQSEEK